MTPSTPDTRLCIDYGDRPMHRDGGTAVLCERHRPFPADLGVGCAQLVQLSDSLGFGVLSVSGVPEPTRVRIEGSDNVYKLTFHMAADPGLVGIDGHPEPLTLTRADSYVLSPSVVGYVDLVPGTHTHELSLFVKPETLHALVEESEITLCGDAVRLITDPDGGPAFVRGRTTAAMRLAAEQLLRCSMAGSLRRMYLEAKAAELVALKVQALAEERTPQDLRLSCTDRAHIREARDIVLAEVVDPPGIAELAMRVGLSATRLKAGYKAIYHTTVFGFVRWVRLDRALDLLRTGEVNVTEAATGVGYSSLSAFSAAFRRHHGFLPRDVPRG